MKQLFFVAVGLVAGYVLARRIGRPRAASPTAARNRSLARAFAAAVADGYRSRGAELRGHPGGHA